MILRIQKFVTETRRAVAEKKTSGFLVALLLAIAVLGAASLATPLADRAKDGPFLPDDDSLVLERLSFGPATDPELRRLRRELALRPADLDLAVNVARRYLESGRESGDPRLMGYAESALGPWWRLNQPPAEVLLLRATVRQNRHDFDGALQDLTNVVRRQPHNAQAWLTRSVLLLVQGDPEAALGSCRPVLRSNPLLATACMANAASAMGRAESAYALLRQALARSPAAAPRERSWALTSLGEIAVRLGHFEAAELHFASALDLAPRDIYLLGALADLLLDLDRPAEVIDLLRDRSGQDALLLRLAIAEDRLDAPSASEHRDVLRRRFAAASRRGESLHQGNESRFAVELLHRPADGLRLAQRNWAIQKEPADARRLLEAALAAGEPAAARPVFDWLDRTGLEDQRLHSLRRQIEGGAS